MLSFTKQILISLGSFFWSALNALLRCYYSSRARRFKVPTICVGNIVAGGVGKTEVVSDLAHYFLKKNLKVAVLQRGYRSVYENETAFSNNYQQAQGLNFPDEALVLLKKNPNLTVFVGRNRLQSFFRHPNFKEFKVLIFDDGFQQFRIKFDYVILVHHFALKAQWYREFKFQLSRANWGISFSDLPATFKQLPHWTEARYRLCTEKKLSNQVVLFCGIGNPQRVLSFLAEQQIEVVGHFFFADHMIYQESDLQRLNAQVQSFAESIDVVTTLKDFVKLEKVIKNYSALARTKVLTIETEYTNSAWLDQVSQAIGVS